MNDPCFSVSDTLCTLSPEILPSVPFADVHMLPSQPGIYFALGTDRYPLYVGATINLHVRWLSHNKRVQLRAMNCVTIAYHLCTKDDLALLESLMIQRFNPALNTPWRPPRERPPDYYWRRTTVVLSDPQYDAMHTLAKKRDLPFSELVRRAIDDYLRYQQEMETRYPNANDITPKEIDHA